MVLQGVAEDTASKLVIREMILAMMQSWKCLPWHQVVFLVHTMGTPHPPDHEGGGGGGGNVMNPAKVIGGGAGCSEYTFHHHYQQERDQARLNQDVMGDSSAP